MMINSNTKDLGGEKLKAMGHDKGMEGIGVVIVDL